MQTLLARLQRALTGRYAVEHELGRGGMATVVLGRDLKLDRRVAIKVYESDSGVVTTGERFLREIRIAAKLQHPNILPVHDSGEGEGLVYYVMPYVAGASLRERLEREGPLPIGDAIRIAREVAEALDHAHRAGIVHRDIKPDNIMLADGVAVVADFGIARAIEESGGKVTDTGLAIGTPNYMSPEQAAAQPNLDGRTDLYALGCVLYEMLAGTPPFGGATAQAVMARHATDAVPPLATVRQVPVALEEAISKALAKIPGDRWATGKTMAEALALAAPTTLSMPVRGNGRPALWVAAIAATLAGVFAVWKWAPIGSVADAAEAATRSVAILPVTVRGDTGLLKYADGMTESLINGLAGLEGLRVPTSDKVFALRDQQGDPQRVGRDLGVEAVLASNLQEAGGKLRLSVQLVDVQDGLVRWTTQYDGSLGDIFAMQDSATSGLADALRLRLAPAKRAQLSRGELTRDSIAYRLYLEANRATAVWSKAGLERAMGLLREAIRRDSTFADAYVALSIALSSSEAFSKASESELASEVRRLVNRAVDIDSLNPRALDAHAWNRMWYEWDVQGALREARRAVALSPGSPTLLLGLADLFNYMQMTDSALVYARRSLAIESTEWGFESQYWAFRTAGMLDSADAMIELQRAANPNSWVPQVYLAEKYLKTGRRADADRAVDAFLRGGEYTPQVLAYASDYYLAAGDLAGARRMEQRLNEIARKGRSAGMNTARAHVRLALGDRAGALDALEAAVRARERLLPMSIFGRLHALRGDRRFEAIRATFYGGHAPPYATGR